MIAAQIIPGQIPNVNAWSAVAVDAALARLATAGKVQSDGGQK